MSDKINLKEILAKHSESFNLAEKGFKVSDKVLSNDALLAMKEVWDMAVDECKKAAKTKPGRDENNLWGEYIDLRSIEQVKNMIK